MTLKAYKQAIKIGAKIKVLEHWDPKQIGNVREVSKVQGNSFAYTVDGVPGRAWSPFPKSAELVFDGRIARVKLEANGKAWALEILGVAS